MTAPGQEPDEIITAKPDGKEHGDMPDSEPDVAEHPTSPTDEEIAADLKAIGDSHMPDDQREAERAKHE